jgi:hypothetical protein
MHTPEGILQGSDKLKAVQDSEPPKTDHQIWQFMGLCNISDPISGILPKFDHHYTN